MERYRRRAIFFSVMGRHVVITFVLILISLVPGFSADLAGVEGSAGLIWIGNMEAEGGSSPIKPIVSVSASLDLGTTFGMEPMVAVTGLLYEFVESDSKPVPAAVEAGDSAYFLTILLDPGANFTFPIGRGTTISAYTSGAILLRIPLIGYGAENVRDAKVAETETNRAEMAWYMHAGRFLYPRIGMKVTKELPMFSRFRGAELTASLDSYWPWLNLFIDENQERGPRFLDQAMIRAGIGLRFSGAGLMSSES